MNILVVDDEKEIAGLVEIYLKNENYKVDVCYTGTQALQNIRTRSYDLAILDVMLPDMDGFSICRTIRQNYTWPIIMLTAKEQDIDKINGLMIGADDYMTKPFDLHELLARIEANLKRTSNTSCQNDTLTYRDIEINNSLVYIKEVLVPFTSTELKILRLLLQYPQKIFSKQNLYESIWNETYAYDDDTINTHISHIRKKIKAITNEDYIQTIWGIGYKIK